LSEEREQAYRQDRNIRIHENKAAEAEHAAAIMALESKIASLSNSNRELLKGAFSEMTSELLLNALLF